MNAVLFFAVGGSVRVCRWCIPLTLTLLGINTAEGIGVQMLQVGLGSVFMGSYPEKIEISKANICILKYSCDGNL